MTNLLISCTVSEERHIKTDHYGIETIINIEKTPAEHPPVKNWRMVDWKKFTAALRQRIEEAGLSTGPIQTEEYFIQHTEQLTKCLQETIQEVVPESRPSSYARRWWNKDLDAMRKRKKELSKSAKDNRALPNHPIHGQLRQHLNEYSEAIEKAKVNHWEEFLTNASTADMWIANGYLKSPVGDAGRLRIPSLKATALDPVATVDTNEKKAELLATSFFPKRPADAAGANTEPEEYPTPLPGITKVTEKTVKHYILALSPYKAPGLDGIPNITLQRTADIIAPHLGDIYTAALSKGFYYQGWRKSITCVLRKPGKPSYEIPKAYRPIALLSTIGKLLSAIVVGDISRLIETHELLPSTHFGGRQGRTTTDSLHYLVGRIKAAWHKKKVVSVLFLDIEGAFPNAVTEKVIHNMKKRQMPEAYVQLVTNMLKDRKTRLKFDDYLLEFIPIDNGIGQGFPLSMILYIIYNADLVDIPRKDGENGAGYVDDVFLYAEADDFKTTVHMIKDMMERQGGGLKWAEMHNSWFEMLKVALMHFSRQPLSPQDRDKLLRDSAPQLKLRGTYITVANVYKYLGVMIDPDLNWKQQEAAAISKAHKWGSRFTEDNLRSRYMLQRIQWLAAIAITGALKSTARDTLDVHANLTPIEIHMELLNRQAYIRMSTLPANHILNMQIHAAHAMRDTVKKQLSPLQQMAQHYRDINPDQVEKIGHWKRPVSFKPIYNTDIAATRQDSINTKNDDNAKYKIYTDGSGIDRQVGAAALLFEDGHTEPTAVRHFHLGSTSHYTTYNAKWVGILLAIWLLTTMIDQARIGINHIRIYADNQLVIQSLESGPRIKKFDIRWISAHSDVIRNEKVDAEAKTAARGTTSEDRELPPTLQRTLPVSKSALIQAAKHDAKEQWRIAWLKSERKGKLDEYDTEFPCKTYLRICRSLPRHQASKLIQLRTGHIPLNTYLQKRKLVETDKCTKCHGGRRETLRHFLFECPAYRKQRSTMDKIHKRAKHNLKLILADGELTKALLKYIDSTGRFPNHRPV
ncbi:hypothetical protein D9619_007720 [Psilocybe cf. subviscida]|uniref:Reverse transcriptase domain-containing protein n=1 Tax=Psilocybe cf. subviscida TaxID=2480587 RepID=A0A8H5ATK7_9AGAR|nr:hypothetical protein D9619_007720 [Psilocybe cf. subviscida]